ncbi:hypothetical protein YW7DRAFT_05014 [Streptomyces sp. AmelKG-E11A]|nr:hypothetical protein YW7DRAFT_05014 [Streptomyces sp. AmelKG-E11A]
MLAGWPASKVWTVTVLASWPQTAEGARRTSKVLRFPLVAVAMTTAFRSGTALDARPACGSPVNWEADRLAEVPSDRKARQPAAWGPRMDVVNPMAAPGWRSSAGERRHHELKS